MFEYPCLSLVFYIQFITYTVHTVFTNSQPAPNPMLRLHTHCPPTQITASDAGGKIIPQIAMNKILAV